MRKEREIAEFYNELSKTYEKEHANRFCDEVLEILLREYLPKFGRRKMRVLDTGGGIGRFSFPLAQQSHSIVLQDYLTGYAVRVPGDITHSETAGDHVLERISHEHEAPKKQCV